MAVKEACEWISSFAGQIAISSVMICGELTCGEWRGRDITGSMNSTATVSAGPLPRKAKGFWCAE